MLKLIAILGFALVQLSCSSGSGALTGEPEVEEPVIPHTLPSFLGLTVATADFPSEVDNRAADKSAHRDAFYIVTGVERYVASRLDIPVEALTSAVSIEATQDASDETIFNWPLSFAALGKNFTGTVVGKNDSATFNWTLTVSSEAEDGYGCCTDFTWMTGSYTDPTQGTWTIFDPKVPAEGEALTFVEWLVTNEQERKVTVYAKKFDAEYALWKVEGVLTYIVSSGSYSLNVDYDVANSESWTIKWTSASKAGTLIDENDVKVCWDADLVNKDDCG